MVSLNNSEIYLIFLDDDEDPDEFPVFFYTMSPRKYRIRVNWVRPKEGLLAVDYDESNRSHTANVVFIVTQMTDALIELLRYAKEFKKNQSGVLLMQHCSKGELRLLHQTLNIMFTGS